MIGAADDTRSDSDVCAVCLETMAAVGSAKFVGPCGHTFHVQCAEANFVQAGRTTCPCCRMEFEHAPGFVAMARAAAVNATTYMSVRELMTGERGVDQGITPVIPDTEPPRSAVVDAAAAAPPLGHDFVKMSVVTDGGEDDGAPRVMTALVRAAFKADSEAHPAVVAADFVILADVSGSMSGEKMSSLRDALLSALATN